jgi:hypothetical protein
MLFGLCVAAPASAAEPQAMVHVWPPPLFAAPTTTHVWVEAQRSFFAGAELAVVPADGARAAGAFADRVTVSVHPTSTNADRVVLEVAPRAALAPVTRYELWRIDAAGRAAPRLISTFVTSRERDATPPSWSGVVRVGLDDGRDPPGTIRYDAPQEPTAVFVLEAAFDRACPPGDLLCRFGDASVPILFGVWVADGVAIDYGAPPAVLFRQPANVVRARREGQPPMFTDTVGDELSPFHTSSFHLPRGRRVRFGVRAVDLSGNRSAPVELELAVPR